MLERAIKYGNRVMTRVDDSSLSAGIDAENLRMELRTANGKLGITSRPGGIDTLITRAEPPSRTELDAFMHYANKRPFYNS